MRNNTNYLDLKEGQRLVINPMGLEIIVVSSVGDECVLRVGGNVRTLNKGQYISLAQDVGMYSFGYRHLGKRTHVRLDMMSYHEYVRTSEVGR